MTIKKLYALQAHGERGKTTTLKMLILKILKNYNVVFNCLDGKILTADELQKQIDEERQTESDIENICGTVKINDKTLAINTAGDNRNEIEKSIELFKSAVDIGICAIRTKGVTLDELNKFADDYQRNSGLEYFIISKLSLSNALGCKSHCDMIDLMNEIQAEMLFNELQSDFN
ncbi:MAG: hypothetical protein K2M75_00485 [Clostridia bacterium]|nr:hypothetical protein [Clostridia bacterium]